jgi:hypothetical protein
VRVLLSLDVRLGNLLELNVGAVHVMELLRGVSVQRRPLKEAPHVRRVRLLVVAQDESLLERVDTTLRALGCGVVIALMITYRFRFGSQSSTKGGRNMHAMR